MPLKQSTMSKSVRFDRCIQSSTKASLSDSYNSILVGVANMLVAVDSDGSKTDNLYNGIPATGAVEVKTLCVNAKDTSGIILHCFFKE